MPILNQPYEKFGELARLADEAGFDSVWDYEFFRNPFLIHALCSGRRTRSATRPESRPAAAGPRSRWRTPPRTWTS